MPNQPSFVVLVRSLLKLVVDCFERCLLAEWVRYLCFQHLKGAPSVYIHPPMQQHASELSKISKIKFFDTCRD